MKNYLLGILSVMVLFGILSFTNILNQSETPDKEWVIAPRFLTLQEGITKEEALEWMEDEYLPLYRYYPGWNAMLGEPIRSGGWGTQNNTAKEKGDFVLIYFFDTKATEDHYFPPNSNWWEQKDISYVLEHHKTTVDKLFGKYFIQDKYQIEEYLMFARAK